MIKLLSRFQEDVKLMFKPFSSVWDGKEKGRGFKTRVFLYYLVYLIFL